MILRRARPDDGESRRELGRTALVLFWTVLVGVELGWLVLLAYAAIALVW